MNKSLFLIVASAAVMAATPAMAVTVDFETDGLGNPTVYNTAVGNSYSNFGATFTNAFFRQCGGGCPTPSSGTFISGVSFSSPLSVTFAQAITGFSFENVSNSGGTASAYDSANNLIASINFSNFPGLFSFSQSGIKSVVFSTGFQYGVDNFTFAATSAMPEAGTWALMILGIGAVGSALRGRRKANVRFAF